MPRMLVAMPSPSKRQRRRHFYQQAVYWFKSDGQDGVNLFDAYIGQATGLTGENDLMFENYGAKVTYKIKFQEKDYSKQKYARQSRGPITRKKVIQQVAQVILDVLRDEYSEDYPVDGLKPFYLLRLERAGVSLFHCIIAYDGTCGPLSASTPIALPAPDDALEEILSDSYQDFHPCSSSVADVALFDTPPLFSSDLVGSSNPDLPWTSCSVYDNILAAMDGVVPPETLHPTLPYQVPNTFGDWSVEQLNSSLENLVRPFVQTLVFHYIKSQGQHTGCQPF